MGAGSRNLTPRASDRHAEQVAVGGLESGAAAAEPAVGRRASFPPLRSTWAKTRYPGGCGPFLLPLREPRSTHERRRANPVFVVEGIRREGQNMRFAKV